VKSKKWIRKKLRLCFYW